ncbi:hypothetical protein [Sphingobacterium sp. GVS05A]|uniref:hypothetical protein n=1 Tax=Sphingobacterium TaxID=28453 RepID=UPI001CC19FFF|nr:hypothetical protein [Sphingobacterium sp. GVS05A]
MKTINKNLMILCLVAMVAMIFVGCSKDKDEPTVSGKIDAIVGTFKGKMVIGGDAEYFNAIITVSKVDDGKVKATVKTGEAYSRATAKTFPVQNISNIHISGQGPMGSITYKLDDKNIQISTEAEANSDIEYFFQGTKQ